MRQKKFLIALLLVAVGMLAACEQQTKEAEERGKVPHQVLDKAKQRVDDAAAKMQEKLGQVDSKDGE